MNRTITLLYNQSNHHQMLKIKALLSNSVLDFSSTNLLRAVSPYQMSEIQILVTILTYHTKCSTWHISTPSTPFIGRPVRHCKIQYVTNSERGSGEFLCCSSNPGNHGKCKYKWGKMPSLPLGWWPHRPVCFDTEASSLNGH